MSKFNIIFFYSGIKTASNVFDHAKAFAQYSKHSINYVDIDSLPTLLEVNQYDIAIIHHSIALLEPPSCSPLFHLLMRKGHVKKVLFLQDEYRQINKMRALINYMNIDVLYTTVPKDLIEVIYPSSLFPNLRKFHTLPGYVPNFFKKLEKVPYEKRNLDVAYRARKLPYWFGTLGYEKWKIAARFKENAQNFGLKIDISTREEDRIYGPQWIKFLQNTKAVLGTEGGASIYDFTGEIQKQSEYYQFLYPKATYKEVESKFFPCLNNKLPYNMISPRVFECAASRTLMILYEASYSGILIPWRHYVPLERDHSNMEQVVEYISNQKLWMEITERTFKEIVCSDQYSYKSFIRKFDESIGEVFSCYFSKKIENLPFHYLDSIKIKEAPPVLKIYSLKQIIKKSLKILPYSAEIIKILAKINVLLKRPYKKAFLRRNMISAFNFYRKEYVRIFQFDPLYISKEEKNSLDIFLDPESEHINRGILEYGKIYNINIKCSDSFAIPEEIRGKIFSVKGSKDIIL